MTIYINFKVRDHNTKPLRSSVPFQSGKACSLGIDFKEVILSIRSELSKDCGKIIIKYAKEWEIFLKYIF